MLLFIAKLNFMKYLPKLNKLKGKHIYKSYETTKYTLQEKRKEKKQLSSC